VVSGLFLNRAAGPPPAGQSLPDLAASLTPGTWGQLTSANIYNSMIDPTSPNTHLRFHFCNSTPWSQDGIDFIGGDHAGQPAFARYNNATNAWDNYIPCQGSHGYQHLTTNPANGDRYLRIGTSAEIYKGDAALIFTPIWTPNGISGTASVALAWVNPGFCGAGAQGAIACYDGNVNGAVQFYDPIAGELPRVDNAMPGASGLYHVVSAYSVPFNCLVYGGGNGFTETNAVDKQVWRLDADRSLTRLKDAPFSYGVYAGNLTPGTDGWVYLLAQGQHWKLDPRLPTNDWVQLPTPPAQALYPNDHAAVLSCSTPYGIVYLFGQNETDIRMMLYRC
jgi:hypothetical protein